MGLDIPLMGAEDFTELLFKNIHQPGNKLFETYSAQPELVASGLTLYIERLSEKLPSTPEQKEIFATQLKATKKVSESVSGEEKLSREHIETLGAIRDKVYSAYGDITKMPAADIEQRVKSALKDMLPIDHKDYSVRDLLLRQPERSNVGAKDDIEKLQHAYLHATLQALGAEVTVNKEKIPPENKLDSGDSLSIFTRDPLFVDHTQKKIFLPSFRRPEHAQSQDILKNHYIEKGYKIEKISAEIEGGNIMQYLSDKGERQNVWFVSNRPSAEYEIRRLAAQTGLDVVDVPQKEGAEGKRVDERFYHLDTFFSVLPNGEVLIYEPATTPEAIAAIKERVGEKQYIAIKEEDAAAMATNLIPVGRTLVMPHCSKALEETLQKLDYQVVTPEKLGLPKDYFQLRRGAAHCMTNELSLNTEIQEGVRHVQSLMHKAHMDPTLAPFGKMDRTTGLQMG